MAVPKLKIADAKPSRPFCDRVPITTPRVESQIQVEKQSPMPDSTHRAVAGSLLGGKENRLTTSFRPKQQLSVDKATPCRRALAAAHIASQAVHDVKTASTITPCSAFPAASELTTSTHALSTAGRAEPMAAGTQAADIPLSLAFDGDQDQLAPTTEDEQAPPALGIPLACHTAVNKRRCCCRHATFCMQIVDDFDSLSLLQYTDAHNHVPIV